MKHEITVLVAMVLWIKDNLKNEKWMVENIVQHLNKFVVIYKGLST